MSARRTFALIALSLGLLLAAACADAEEELKQEPTPSPTAAASDVSTPPPPSSPTTTGEIPADWKMYTDSEFGFSLRYPPGFGVEDLSDPSSPLSQRVLQFRPSEGASAGFALVIADNDKALSPEEWAREFSTCPLEPGDEVDRITVDGADGVTCLGEPIAGKFETVVVLTRDENIMYLTSTLSESDFEHVISGLDLF